MRYAILILVHASHQLTVGLDTGPLVLSRNGSECLVVVAGWFFWSADEDEVEQTLELSSINMPRTEQCLWLGHHL
jgi:hypothetical protein